MNFSVASSIAVLERTPLVLSSLLRNLSAEWTTPNEGANSWSAFDIVGHLIHGERTDWVPRAQLILSARTDKTFEPFDRFAQFELSKGKTLEQLLDEFTTLREENIAWLRAQPLSQTDLEKKGRHPALGEVTLAQLLATWTVHDLNHLAQVSRVMAKQYKDEVGPWQQYLGVLHQ